MNIEIYFKDGNCRIWRNNKYTDYMYYKQPNIFVIINGSQWVGIYNLDEIKEIIIQ